MATSPTTITCPTCGQSTTGVPKRTFLGFQQIACTGCKAVTKFPLTVGYRMGMWAVALWMSLSFFGIGSQPNLFASLIFAAAVLSLLEDARLLRKHRAAPTSSTPS
jgi:hypothetical protein